MQEKLLRAARRGKRAPKIAEQIRVCVSPHGQGVQRAVNMFGVARAAGGVILGFSQLSAASSQPGGGHS